MPASSPCHQPATPYCLRKLGIPYINLSNREILRGLVSQLQAKLSTVDTVSRWICIIHTGDSS